MTRETSDQDDERAREIISAHQALVARQKFLQDAGKGVEGFDLPFRKLANIEKQRLDEEQHENRGRLLGADLQLSLTDDEGLCENTRRPEKCALVKPTHSDYCKLCKKYGGKI